MVRTSVAVRVSGTPADAVLRPMKLFSARLAILARVTLPSLILAVSTASAASIAAVMPPVVIEIALAPTEIPEPTVVSTCTVTLPDNPVPPSSVRPLPAVIPEMSPLPSNVIHSVPLLNFRALLPLL